MTDTIKNLRALLTAATPWPWSVAHGAPIIRRQGAHCALSLPSGNTSRDGAAIVALRNAADALLDVAEAAREYLDEMDNPSPCHVMRKQWRGKMRAALAELKKLEETDGE